MALCKFLGLDEERLIDLKIDNEYDLAQLVDINSDKSKIKEDQSEWIQIAEKNYITQTLKVILGHKEVVNTIDNKIAKLEEELLIFDPHRPVPGKLLRQLDLLLHKLPSNIRAKYLTSNS